MSSLTLTSDNWKPELVTSEEDDNDEEKEEEDMLLLDLKSTHISPEP